MGETWAHTVPSILAKLVPTFAQARSKMVLLCANHFARGGLAVSV